MNNYLNLQSFNINSRGVTYKHSSVIYQSYFKNIKTHPDTHHKNLKQLFELIGENISRAGYVLLISELTY